MPWMRRCLGMESDGLEQKVTLRHVLYCVRVSKTVCLVHRKEWQTSRSPRAQSFESCHGMHEKRTKESFAGGASKTVPCRTLGRTCTASACTKQGALSASISSPRAALTQDNRILLHLTPSQNDWQGTTISASQEQSHISANHSIAAQRNMTKPHHPPSRRRPHRP